MSHCLPFAFHTTVPAQTGRIIMSGATHAVGTFRVPTDPLYYATLTLQNVVANSRYRVTRTSTGDELATGVGGGSDIELTGIPCYTNPMLVNIVIRNASGATKYKAFETSAYIYRTGGSAYVIQVED